MFDSNKWNVMTQDEGLVKNLSQALKIDKISARLLINRGYEDKKSADDFIKKSDVFFHDPFLMKDMDKACKIIENAISEQKRITIYGDYDVDGVTSVSILYLYLKDHGALVDYYIPTRDSEGYGLNIAAFDLIKKRGTELIITVDTGITAVEEVEYAKSIGIDIVITDHHQCRSELPNASAVVNPKRPDCEYPFKELSGVGVVFKTLCALELNAVNGGEYNLYTIKNMCKRYIDIVTIGTIADVMPLIGENRIIVYLGLQMLQNVSNVGVKALFRAAGVIGNASQKRITASTIGFTIAPKINAVGRIGSAERAVKLFLTNSPGQADIIAEELCAINHERQETENIIYKEAFSILESYSDIKSQSAIVLDSDTWHHGVVGIVASRITEKFGIPSVLISFEGVQPDEEGRIIGKGSVRSVKGINIVEALEACSDLLFKYGGHALAAGLSIEKKNVDLFRERLNAYISKVMESSDCDMKIPVDLEISAKDVNEKTTQTISLLEPYGAGNPVPTFLLKGAKIVEIMPLSGGKHSKLIIQKDKTDINAIMFGTPLNMHGFLSNDTVDIICNMEINDFRGMKTVQLIIKDIDHSEFEKKLFSQISSRIEKVEANPKIANNFDIPDRNDFKSIYLYLKRNNCETVNLRELARIFFEFSYLKLYIILKTLAQAKIITLDEDKKEEFIFKIKFKETDGKADLLKTPIMSALTLEKAVK